MRESLELDPVALAAYLETQVAGFRGPLTATKFKGGQSNPTYRIDAASGSYVLRRKPPGKLLASAHAVDREFRVLQALSAQATGVPVARPLHLCSDESVIGSMFYLMEFVDGRIFWDPALPDVAAEDRGRYYDAIVDAMAALHRVNPGAVGLADYGKPGNYFARQIARWSEQYRASETQSIPAMEALIERLPARCPEDDGRIALAHGDFRIDNLMFDRDEAKLAAIVDWELSTLGHPLADLGYFCMALRLPRNPALPGLAGMDRAALGIPDEAAVLRRYAEKTGFGIPGDWDFVIAFSYFRLAAIAQGVAKRAQQGNASSEQAMQAGAMTALLAKSGLSALG
ncbi:phosphotransferase family protein [Arenimonas sp.]|uniref:phosphotransferase family protein n=1 Tax=Arenimonas sp. TaxID=1872635 RepID=UPI0039E5F79A